MIEAGSRWFGVPDDLSWTESSIAFSFLVDVCKLYPAHSFRYLVSFCLLIDRGWGPYCHPTLVCPIIARALGLHALYNNLLCDMRLSVLIEYPVLCFPICTDATLASP